MPPYGQSVTNSTMWEQNTRAVYILQVMYSNWHCWSLVLERFWCLRSSECLFFHIYAILGHQLGALDVQFIYFKRNRKKRKKKKSKNYILSTDILLHKHAWNLWRNNLISLTNPGSATFRVILSHAYCEYFCVILCEWWLKMCSCLAFQFFSVGFVVSVVSSVKYSCSISRYLRCISDLTGLNILPVVDVQWHDLYIPQV